MPKCQEAFQCNLASRNVSGGLLLWILLEDFDHGRYDSTSEPRAEHDTFATPSIDNWWQWWHGGVGRNLGQQLLAAMPLVTWQLSCAELAFTWIKPLFLFWAMSNGPCPMSCGTSTIKSTLTFVWGKNLVWSSNQVVVSWKTIKAK